MKVYTFLKKQINDSIVSFMALIVVSSIFIPYLFVMSLSAQKELIDLVKSSQAPALNKAFRIITIQFVLEATWRVRDWIKNKLSTDIRMRATNESLVIILNNEYKFFESNKVSLFVANSRQICENTERIVISIAKLACYIGYIVYIIYGLKHYSYECLKILILFQGIFLLFAIPMFILAFRKSNIATKAKNAILLKLYDILRNISSIIIYKKLNKEHKNLTDATNDIRVKERSFENHLLIVWSVEGIVFGLIMWQSLKQLIRYNCSAGSIVITMNFIYEFFGKMWNSAQELSDIVEHTGKLSNNIEAIYGGIKKIPTYIRANGIIKLENVQVNIGSKAIHLPNLTIKQGETLIVLGSSGSGKSTLIRVLAGFIAHDKGEVYNGICDFKGNSIAYMPQNLEFFENTVIYNIGYGCNNKIQDSHIEELLSIPIFRFIESRGLDAQVGTASISGGERQKLFLARVFLKYRVDDVKLLILDEPTSALDEESEKLALELISSIKCTKIVVTHKESLFLKYLNVDQVLRI